MNFFSSQKDLDDHTCKYHTFICQICQHISKTLPDLDFHKDIMHDTTPRKLPAIHPEDEEMVHGWETQNDGGRSAERVGPVERCKGHGSQRKMGLNIGQHGQLRNHWMKEKEKGKKRKYDTKEEADAAAGDDKDRDPDYVQSEEGSSQDPLYEPS